MAEETLSIGDVINLLRDDFPDVSVSKLRFLEAQGLISPGRSSAGYRQFGRTEVKRLRYILGLQRDHFLPLKVIKSKLTLWDRGEDPGSVDAGDLAMDSDGEPIPRSDLVRRSGLTSGQIASLVDHGVLPADGDDILPGWALPAAIEARQLLELGFEPRHLRQVRLAADKGIELIRQLITPLLGSQQSEVRRRAAEGLEVGAEAVAALHRILLTAQVRNLLHE
ncbi:MAG: transcriptional regulator FtsR [Actinomycetota bacterium]